MIKIIAIVLIIFACGAAGFVMSSRLEKRVKLLTDIVTALTQMEMIVSYGNLPLTMALKQASQSIGGPFSEFLRDVAGLADDPGGGSIRDIWQEQLEKMIKTDATFECLLPVDIDIVRQFASTLGQTDLKNQIKNFTLTKARLEANLLQAADICSKRAKVYKSVGILAGICLAVVLI